MNTLFIRGWVESTFSQSSGRSVNITYNWRSIFCSLAGESICNRRREKPRKNPNLNPDRNPYPNLYLEISFPARGNSFLHLLAEAKRGKHGDRFFTSVLISNTIFPLNHTKKFDQLTTK